MAELPVLQPNGTGIETMPCPDAKEHIVTILLRSCRREPSGIARCVALSSIAMFAYRELSHNTLHPRVPEAITVLLQALRVRQNTFVKKLHSVYIFWYRMWNRGIFGHEVYLWSDKFYALLSQ